MTVRNLSILTFIAFTSFACSSSDNGGETVTDSAIDSAVFETGESDSTAIEDTAPAADSAAETAVIDAPAETSIDASLDATDASDAAEVSDAADGDKPCKSGNVEERACGKCGTQSRLCSMGAWLDWGLCGEETGVCVPGDTRDASCGLCGTQKQTCSATCDWSSTTACTGEGGCVAGSTETQSGSCLDPTQVKSRTCSATCSWSDWSDCH
ncbi:MAG: hypothetical protein ACXVEF_43250 [Polyangiales bacterium]